MISTWRLYKLLSPTSDYRLYSTVLSMRQISFFSFLGMRLTPLTRLHLPSRFSLVYCVPHKLLTIRPPRLTFFRVHGLLLLCILLMHSLLHLLAFFLVLLLPRLHLFQFRLPSGRFLNGLETQIETHPPITCLLAAGYYPQAWRCDPSALLLCPRIGRRG